MVGFFRSFFRGAAEEDCDDYHNYLLQALGEFPSMIVGEYLKSTPYWR